jgi:hypothetical protein
MIADGLAWGANRFAWGGGGGGGACPNAFGSVCAIADGIACVDFLSAAGGGVDIGSWFNCFKAADKASFAARASAGVSWNFSIVILQFEKYKYPINPIINTTAIISKMPARFAILYL